MSLTQHLREPSPLSLNVTRPLIFFSCCWYCFMYTSGRHTYVRNLRGVCSDGSYMVLLLLPHYAALLYVYTSCFPGFQIWRLINLRRADSPGFLLLFEFLEGLRMLGFFDAGLRREREECGSMHAPPIGLRSARSY